MRKTIAAVVLCIGALELHAATCDVLVTVEDRRVERWQVTDGAWTKSGEFGDWKSLKLAPVAVAASPAKKVYVACAGASNTLEEFAPDGAHLRTVATFRFRPFALDLSPDGKWACLTARSRTIHRISLATGEVKPLVQNASIYTTGLAFGPGGLLYLGSAYDGLVSVYDVTKTLADDTAAKRLGAIRAFDCQSGFAFGGADLGRLIVPGTWYESIDLDRGESDVGYPERPALGICRATVRVGGEVYAADCGSSRTLVRIPATAGTVENVADMTGPVSSMANLTETFDGSEPARFAAAKKRTFASEPKLAGGMTDFERMNYNHPGLEVDLEGGIWPMPMICADDALEIRTRSVPRVCTLHFAKKAPYRYSAGAEVRSGESRPKYSRTAGCAAPGAPSGAMRKTGKWNDYYADLNGDGTVDCLRLYSDWTKYGAAGPACKIVYDEKGYWTTGQVQFDAYVYLREGGIAGGRWAAPRKVLPDDFNAAKEGPWGEGGAVFADFDGDGDVDFVTGDFRSELWYVENVGTRTEPTFAKPRRARDTAGNPLEGDLCMMAVLADDYDGDGKTDVVAGEEDGRISVFRNTGKLTADRTPVFEPQRFVRQEADVLTFGCLVTPYAVDWDGDGDLDFICGNSAGYIVFIENLSGPGVERPKWAAPRRMTVKDPAKCRVEMWLRGDVIQSRGGDSSSPQGPAEAKWGYTVCTVADWDGDGFLDVMANDIKGSVVWFRNPGRKGATCLEAPRAVEVEWEGAQPRFAWEWRKPPKGKALRAPWRTTPLMHDWDGDGLVDLIMLDTEGRLALYRRAKENGRLVLKPPRPLVHDLSGKPMKFHGARGGSGRRKFCICDWDGDGRLDFLINGSNVYALLNRGEKDGKAVFEETRKLARKTLSGHSSCPTVVDFNADGIPDIVSGAEDGNFYYFRNPRTTAQTDKFDRAVGVRRIYRPERSVRGNENIRPGQAIDRAAWIWMPGDDRYGEAAMMAGRGDRSGFPARFYRFRRSFEAQGAAPLRIDVSADERFVLFLDGLEIARGPHRGMPDRWFYESYEIDLDPGTHRLEAVVWQMGPHAPLAQLSVRGGFVLKAEGAYDAVLSTGRADWKVAPLLTTEMTGRGGSAAWGVGSESRSNGTSFYGEEPAEKAWTDAVIVRRPIGPWCCGVVDPGWFLFPSALPDQLHRRCVPGEAQAARSDLSNACYRAENARHPLVEGFASLLKGRPLTIPARTEVRLLWNLGNYYCAYPELRTQGGRGAEIRWDWTESLRNESDGRKGDRAAFADKRVERPFGDVFVPDGREQALFTTPWWRCGRWCELRVRTGDEPLTLASIALWETRYPMEASASFACDDPTLGRVQEICTRGLQMCMHEMYFDCPYYEQHMYPGDGRVEFLLTGLVNADERLVRQSMTLFDEARTPNGLVPMNFPSRMRQVSATYTMCWIDMFRDYLEWRSDRAWLKARLPGIEAALAGLRRYENAEGLLVGLPGWSFTDYTPDWPDGISPDGASGLSAMNSLQYVHSLRSAAEVADELGEPALAAVWRTRAAQTADAVVRTFWDEKRGMLSDTVRHDAWSEQAQCFGILSGTLTGEQRDRAFRGLVSAPDLVRATQYFSHYLFETYFAFGRTDLFLRRLDPWRGFVRDNMSTLLEMPTTPKHEARSDCHAWGAHPPARECAGCQAGRAFLWPRANSSAAGGADMDQGDDAASEGRDRFGFAVCRWRREGNRRASRRPHGGLLVRRAGSGTRFGRDGD